MLAPKLSDASKDANLTTRYRLYRLFEGWDHPGAPTSWVDWCLIVLILVNVFAVTLESVSTLSERHHTLFLAIELISVVVFAVEYVFRVYLCVEDPARRGQGPVTARLRYLCTPLALIDLIAFLPALVSLLSGGLFDLRFLRIVRLIRILKLARYSIALQVIFSVMKRDKRTLLAALFIVLIALQLAATGIYLAEHKAQPENFGSIPQAMWWAIATLTTVGYGDVVPVTMLGRVLGGVSMLAGIGLFVIWTGIFASSFSEEIRRRAFRVSWEMVARVPAFKSLNAAQIGEIAGLLRPLSVPERHQVLRRGDAPNAMFFIVNGEIEIDIRPEPILLHDGDFFGELGLIHDLPKRISAVALRETSLLVLDAEAFRRLMADHQDVRAHILSVASERQHWHDGEGDQISAV